MNDLDREIEEALDAEDRRLMEQFGEQGLWDQAFSVYGGKQGWIAMIVTAVIFLVSIGAGLSAWKFFGATEMTYAVRWGALAWFLVMIVAFMKIWFWMRMESNRVLREIKRVELQLARIQNKSGA